MVHAPSPVRRRRRRRAPVPRTPLPAALVALLLGSGAAGCGIDNVPTRDGAADLAWVEVQAREGERAALARELETAFGAAPGSDRGDDPVAAALEAVRRARARLARTDVSPGTLGDPAAFARLAARQDALGAALRELVGTAVRDAPDDPDLATFADRIDGAERRVAFARAGYAEAARRYNVELRTVPGRWWRRLVYPHMGPRQTFPPAPAGVAARAGPSG